MLVLYVCCHIRFLLIFFHVTDRTCEDKMRNNLHSLYHQVILCAYLADLIPKSLLMGHGYSILSSVQH